jgi:DNA-binding NarL/FixJ family response regulator
MIRVLITDDQRLIRDGLRALICAEDELEITGEASNGLEAIEQCRRLTPDVVLMDIRMPEMTGVEATRIIKEEFPDTKVIILTTFDDDEYIVKAMTHGASGYLLKDIEGKGLVSAIKNSMMGNVILPGKIAAKLTARLSNPTEIKTIDSNDFTKREKEIIKLMVVGKSNSEISQTLYLSTGTVKNYISQIYMKINVRDRTNAILYFKNTMKL